MNIEEKRKIAFRIWNWGAQPVKFVRDYLRDDIDNFGDSSMDEPRLRSHYILLSYGFEMILKSRVAMLLTVQGKDELNEKLQKIGHNFVKISDILSIEELKNIGIAKVELKTAKCNNPKNREDEYSYFIIETVDGKKISIENFTDIRYGCIGGGMRIVDKEEHKKILEYTTVILEIWEKVKTANDGTC
ncbi:MAG: hypothetical protein Q8R29_02805 [bacterium]|nr:hypothetical protein [bacterium]